MKNNFDRIKHLKELGVWEEDVLPLAARLSTLERYFNIYFFILQHEPEKKYGYVPRILADKEFVQLFGNQYDEPQIHKIVRMMEQFVPK